MTPYMDDDQRLYRAVHPELTQSVGTTDAEVIAMRSEQYDRLVRLTLRPDVREDDEMLVMLAHAAWALLCDVRWIETDGIATVAEVLA